MISKRITSMTARSKTMRAIVLVGAVAFPFSAFAADCSGTIATGGTSQALNLPATLRVVNGLRVCNLDTTEPLWLNINGTAVAATQGSVPLQAAAASYTAAGGCFDLPTGWTLLPGAASVVAATLGHKYTCWWR